MTTHRFSSSRKVILVALILLLGFSLRAVDIDATSFRGDEAWIAFLAFSWGHNGQRQEMGVISSTSLPQSPFHDDLFAIPFSFDPDVRVARLFMAGLHLVSMAVLYLFVRRYWSDRTALAALILYAAMPHAAWAARGLWHPNLALPFVIGYLATGFLAAEGKAWGRRLHPIMLCCAMQSHPVMTLLAPLTLGFMAHDWIRAQVAKRWRLALDYLAGAGVAALLLVPWIISIIDFRASNPAKDTFANLGQASPPERILSYLIDIPTRLVYKNVPNTGYIPPPDLLVTALRGIGWFTLLACLFVVGRAVLKRRYADLMIGLAYLILPALLLIVPERTYDHYQMLVMPAAAVIQAIALVGSERRSAKWLRAAALIIGVVCVLQVSVVIYTIRQYYSFQTFTRDQIPSLAEMSKFRDQAVRPGYETIYLLEGFTDTEFTQSMMWIVLAAKGQGPSRVIWGDSMALPVPAAGATYVGFTDATHIPELYANRTPRVSIGNVYKAVDLPPNSGFTPTCQPQGPVRLGNGATILGYYAPAGRSPRSGQPWTVYLLWQGQVSSAHQNYQLFNHLVDAQGNRYGQRDMSSLPTDLWHDGEQLVSKVTLTANDSLPADGPLFLRVGMYTLADMVNTPVLDGDGNPVAAWVTIPVC